MPLSRSDRRSTCASGSCSSRCTLCRRRRNGGSQCPSTMMERRWTSLMEVGIDDIELPYQLRDIGKEKFCLRQLVALEAAGQDCGDGKCRSVGSQDVVRRVAHGDRDVSIGPDPPECHAENLRRRFGELGVAFGGGSVNEFSHAEELRIVIDLVGI